MRDTLELRYFHQPLIYLHTNFDVHLIYLNKKSKRIYAVNIHCATLIFTVQSSYSAREPMYRDKNLIFDSLSAS